MARHLTTDWALVPRGARCSSIRGLWVLGFACLLEGEIALTGLAQQRDLAIPSQPPTEVMTAGMRAPVATRPVSLRETPPHSADDGRATQTRRRLVVRQGGQIGLQFPRPDQVNTARVMSQQGKLLLETRTLEQDLILDMAHLSPGTYDLELESEGKKQSAELIVR